MKNIYIICLVLVCPTLAFGQYLEVIGQVKVSEMAVENSTDSVVVNLPDGTLAVQPVSTFIDQMSEMRLDAGLNGTVKDIDGNAYKTRKIGSQVWMTENLKATRFNDGTAIPEVTDTVAWSGLTTPGYSWYGNDSILHASFYGALYNFHVVVDTNSLNVCPSGWHVPTDAEWTVLEDYLENSGFGYEGSGADIGKSLAATFAWSSSLTEGTVGNNIGSNNSGGYEGLPGGVRSFNGLFNSIGTFGFWWTSSELDSSLARNRYLTYTTSPVFSNFSTKNFGYSVRCLRD